MGVAVHCHLFLRNREFIVNNELLFERISNVELKQLEYQRKTDEKLEQIYDAFSLIVSLIQKADSKIVLIDNYVDVDTLNLLSKKKENVTVTVYTLIRTRLSSADIANFNAQYPLVEVKHTRMFHDRFLKGVIKRLAEQILKKLEKGKSVEKISYKLEVPIELIRRIIDDYIEDGRIKDFSFSRDKEGKQSVEYVKQLIAELDQEK